MNELIQDLFTILQDGVCLMFDLVLSCYSLIADFFLYFRSGGRSDCSGHCVEYVQVLPMYKYELLYLSFFPGS
jgi:hypothetical protein